MFQLARAQRLSQSFVPTVMTYLTIIDRSMVAALSCTNNHPFDLGRGVKCLTIEVSHLLDQMKMSDRLRLQENGNFGKNDLVSTLTLNKFTSQ